MRQEGKVNAVEEKRKADFEKTCEEFKQQGYLRVDKTANILLGNLAALLTSLPFAAVGVWIYWRFHPSVDMRPINIFWMLVCLVVLIVLHELLHGLVFGIFAKNHFRSVRFGVVWKAVAPYCN